MHYDETDIDNRMQQRAANWQCQHRQLCYAQVTADGEALDLIHWATCPLFDGDAADVFADRFGMSEAIDLRAGRSVEIDTPW